MHDWIQENSLRAILNGGTLGGPRRIKAATLPKLVDLIAAKHPGTPPTFFPFPLSFFPSFPLFLSSSSIGAKRGPALACTCSCALAVRADAGGLPLALLLLDPVHQRHHRQVRPGLSLSRLPQRPADFFPLSVGAPRYERVKDDEEQSQAKIKYYYSPTR